MTVYGIVATSYNSEKAKAPNLPLHYLSYQYKAWQFDLERTLSRNQHFRICYEEEKRL